MQEGGNARLQLLQRLTAMTERILALARQLGTAQAVGGNKKQRIVTEALIAAVGQKVIPVHDETVPVAVTSRGTYVVDPVTLQTSVEWIFAGGDTVLGPQTVAKAVCQGLDAAESMHRYMQGLY